MLEAGSYRYLQRLEGPPAGWWYDRAVPKPLRRSLGRGRVRRFLSPERPEAERRYGEVQEEVQRLLALSSGVLTLRSREVRLVACDCARDWQRQRGPLALAELPNEADLAELLVNGFRSRGLVLTGERFLLAREAFCAQLKLPGLQNPTPPPQRWPSTVAGWVAQRQQQGSGAASSGRAWQRELQRLLSFSEVSLPAAVSEGAAWRWRNHLFATASFSTAQRRLSLIRSFYGEACRQGGVEQNPFALLPPLALSALPPPGLDPQLLAQLDRQRAGDPLYLLVRLLGLRASEAAGLRPLDWGLWEGKPALWIRPWSFAGLERPCRPGQQRLLPLPESLVELWDRHRGPGVEPLWPQQWGRGGQGLGQRWATHLRRQGGCSAQQLRLDCQRRWRSQGADALTLRQLLGSLGGLAPASPAARADLYPWVEGATLLPDPLLPSALLPSAMLHCPTDQALAGPQP